MHLSYLATQLACGFSPFSHLLVFNVFAQKTYQWTSVLSFIFGKGITSNSRHRFHGRLRAWRAAYTIEAREWQLGLCLVHLGTSIVNRYVINSQHRSVFRFWGGLVYLSSLKDTKPGFSKFFAGSLANRSDTWHKELSLAGRLSIGSNKFHLENAWTRVHPSLQQSIGG